MHTFLPGTEHRSIGLASLLIRVLLCLLTCSILAQSTSAQDSDPAKVVFLPFRVELTGDYQHLELGLPNILASRLAARTGVDALHKGKVPSDIAASLAQNQLDRVGSLVRQAKADYMVMGSISRPQDQYELTAYVFAANPKTPPRHYIQSVASLDEIMDGVDTLAWDIAEGVFGKSRPQQQRGTATKESGMAAFQTAHPDRAYREGLFANSGEGLQGAGAFSLTDSRSSGTIDFTPVDMVQVDLDGDGIVESVLASNTGLMIYQFMDDAFRFKASIDLARHLRVHAITAADLNGNGRPELYISANNGQLPASTVLEYDGNTATILIDGAPYYLRADQQPGQAARLLGQVKGLDGPAGGTIYAMHLANDSTLVREEAQTLPMELNLFDYIQADLDGDQSQETVVIDQDNRLRVYDAAGSLLWQSSTIYGATDNYLGTKSTMGMEQFKSYVPARMVLADLDNDGHLDLIISRNRLETVRFMKQIRYWEGSSITALTWKEQSLAPLWETRKSGGYTVGYGIQHLADDSWAITYAEGPGKSVFSLWDAEGTTLHRLLLTLNDTTNQTGQ